MKHRTILSLVLMLALIFSFSLTEVNAADEIVETDVAVIGGGGAGLTAAVSAAENDASVALLEKNPFLGGNTLVATGAIFASGTLLSLEEGYYNEPYKIAETILKSDDENLANERLVRKFAAESGPAVNWLKSQGVEFFSVDEPGYTHTTYPDGSGWIDGLHERAEELGVDILMETRGTELIEDNERVAGVLAEKEEKEIKIYSDTVIVATGGFAANTEMVEQYRPEYAGLPLACVEGSTGDGILMAEEVGADTVDIEQLMPVPTLEIESERLITAMMRGADGSSIIVNEEAERFADEIKLYEPLTEVVLNEMQKFDTDYVYQIFDDTAIERVPIAEDYADLAVQAESIKGLAEELTLDQENLQNTVDEFNRLVIDEGRTDSSGVEMHPLNNPPFYALKVTPGILASRGGLRINDSSQVLNSENQPIQGLYAAGETIGGVFGSGYQGGGFYMEALVTGRLSGVNAAIDALVD